MVVVQRTMVGLSSALELRENIQQARLVIRTFYMHYTSARLSTSVLSCSEQFTDLMIELLLF